MSTERTHELEIKISYILRYGVFLSALFLGIGWGGNLLSGQSQGLYHYQTYQPISFVQQLEQALTQKQWFVLLSYIGLAILISLPLIRVLLTGILFARHKEKAMSFMAFAVFAILIGSFCLGIDL